MKYILLAVTGLSPQVITETLYTIYQNNQHVDAIHIITTRQGKEKIYATLLSGPNAPYYSFLREYNIDKSSIAFDHSNIHSITDKYGNEISDIITVSENEHLLKKCLDLTFSFTKDPNTSVYFSVAGGRKTMSSCLTLAAQLYGRPQDRLYHVLVSPEFENSRNFYYPPKKSKTIELKDKNGDIYYKKTEFVRINLINIPFISIRDNLSPDFLNEPKDPATLMLSIIKDNEALLTVNLVTKKLIYKKKELDMMPAHLALYAFFAFKKKSCTMPQKNCGTCTDCFMEISEIFEDQYKLNDIYTKLCGSRPISEMSDTGVTQLSSSNFNSYKSKIKKLIQTHLGLYALKDIEISSIGLKPKKYGIMIDKANIMIVS